MTSDPKVLWDVFFGQYHLPPFRLRDDAIIFDLGANVGYSMLDYAVRYENAHIIGVELDFENATLAERNVKKYSPRCSVVHAAIWREDGEVAYDGEAEEWGYSVSRSNADDGVKYRFVRALKIDTLMKEMGIEYVDFLKMDIEGAEAEVIHQGAEWMHRVGMISLELHSPATYENMSNILAGSGFQCYRSKTHPNSLIAISKDRIAV